MMRTRITPRRSPPPPLSPPALMTVVSCLTGSPLSSRSRSSMTVSSAARTLPQRAGFRARVPLRPATPAPSGRACGPHVLEEGHPFLGAILVPVDHMGRIDELDALRSQSEVDE